MGAWHSLKVLAFVWGDFVRWYVKAKAAGHSRAFYDAVYSRWGRGVMDAAGVDVHVRGLENVGPGPYLAAPNHQGNFDVPAMMSVVPGRLRFVMKRELLRVPIFGRMLWKCGMIAINRGDRRQAIETIEAALRELQPGEIVFMFPEGTRSRDGRLGKPKRGTFYFAVHTGLPILPIAISGSFDRFPGNRYLAINPGPIHIQVLPAIRPDPAGGDLQVDVLQQRWEAAIRAALGEAPPADAAHRAPP